MKKILMFLMTLFLLAGCGKKEIEEYDYYDYPGGENVKSDYVILRTDNIKTEVYQDNNFTITIPSGWEVKTGGYGMTSFIGAYNPDDTRFSIIYVLKMEPLLHTEEGKKIWQSFVDAGQTEYEIFANAPVLLEPTTEGFFKAILQDFNAVDHIEANSEMGIYSLGDEILRGTFMEEGKEAEGLFTASIVDFGSFDLSYYNGNPFEGYDCGYYMAYNVTIVSAPKDLFLDWSKTLLTCISSLQFSDSFVDTAIKSSNDQVTLSRQISKNFNEVMDGFMASWENRNRSFDIMSQKQSDAILGYERVYDTETNEIYKATNGFMDVYDEDRFKPITEDMYSEPISGYIEKQ